MLSCDVILYAVWKSTGMMVISIFFFSSLHLSFMNGCLGNIQWSRLQPVLLLAATRFFRECFMPTDACFSFPISVLSLSSIHILLDRVSFSFRLFTSFAFRLTSFGSSLFRKRPPAGLWSFTGLRSCVVFKFCFAFRSECDGELQLTARFDLAPFQKTYRSRTFSPKTTRCLGLLRTTFKCVILMVELIYQQSV